MIAPEDVSDASLRLRGIDPQGADAKTIKKTLGEHIALFRRKAAKLGLQESLPPGHWMILDGIEICGRKRSNVIKTPHNSDGLSVAPGRMDTIGQFNVFNGAALCILPDGRCAATPVHPGREQEMITILEGLGYTLTVTLNIPTLNSERFVDPTKGDEWERLRTTHS